MDYADHKTHSGVYLQKEKTVRQIAFFDFDGTVTYKDTLLEIAKYYKGKAAWLAGMLQLSPGLVAMKLRLLSNTAVKEQYLRRFFGGMRLNDFQQMCDAFQSDCYGRLIRPAALEAIQRHQRHNTPVVLVSASPENWLKGWCANNNITCIATRLEINEGIVTGKIAGQNCYGPEKVRRIQELYRLEEYDRVYCYGDSSGDRELLQIAHEPHYKPFRP